MEDKVEKLLQKGLSILFELRTAFIKEWKVLLPSLKYRNHNLVDEIDGMVQFAIREVLNKKEQNIDAMILLLLAEWQKRFSGKIDEYESIFLLTTIENIFHKLLSNHMPAAIMDHQAVQAFFLRIIDQAIFTHDNENRVEKWAKIIIASNILPMKWVAIVKKEQEDYQLESVTVSSRTPSDSHLLEMCLSLKANTIDHLSLGVMRLLGASIGKDRILKIHCYNDILLICLEDGDWEVQEQQIEFIQELYFRQLKLSHLENKIDWKNASLLFLQLLLPARSADEAVNAITKGIVEYMPFKRCALFLYNQSDEKGIGVSGYNLNNSAIQQIKEEIFRLPFIKKYVNSLTHSQPLYFSEAAEVFPAKYVHEYKLRSIVVLPIFVPTKNKLLGVALLDRGEHSQFTLSAMTVSTLIKFGHYAGELLFSIWDETLQQFAGSNSLLTSREKEVLTLIAEGASISEAAKKLHLSSYTVRDYVSAIIQKLEAKNRTDAAVKAVRMNLIS